MELPGLERSVQGFETLTVDNTAAGIGGTAATVGNATAAFYGPVETADIRWRVDGTAPTASVGHLLPVQKTLYIEGTDQIKKILFIRTGAVSASVPVTYYI